MLTAGTITVQDGAGFLLSNMKGNAAMNAGSDLHDVVLMSATGSISGLEDGQSLAARISGLFAVYYQDATLSRDGNDILLNATLRQETSSPPRPTRGTPPPEPACSGKPAKPGPRLPAGPIHERRQHHDQ